MAVSQHRWLRLIAAAVCTLLASGAAALADEVTLRPLKDNTIFSESNSTSNGAGVGIFAGKTATGAIRRALLAFDVAAAIPAGSTITSAQLMLTVTMSIAGEEKVTIHRLLNDWGEGASNATSNGGGSGAPAVTGDATWRFRFFRSVRWDEDGGDFVADDSAFEPVSDTGTATWGSTPQMVADVQAWLDAPQSNFGWLVQGNESHNRSAKRFASRQSASQSQRPRLVIGFQTKAVGPTASATPTATAIPTTTATPTASATSTASATPTATVPATATDTSTSPPILTATPTVTAAPPSPTPSQTPLPTATAPAPSASPTFTAVAPACVGDCNAEGAVTINEIISCVNIALGGADPSACPQCDPSGNGSVEINELIAAVNNALNGCPL